MYSAVGNFAELLSEECTRHSTIRGRHFVHVTGLIRIRIIKLRVISRVIIIRSR